MRTKRKKPVKKSSKSTPNNKGGRPTDYRTVYADQAYKLCLLGATDKEMADFFEVAESTINLWKLKHQKFSESIKKGKIYADSNVADRLYQRAMGFEHDSEEIKVVSDGSGEGSSVVRVPIRKVYPPDPTSMIFFLKNRRAKQWRDRQEIEVSDGRVKITVTKKKTSDDAGAG